MLFVYTTNQNRVLKLHTLSVCCIHLCYFFIIIINKNTQCDVLPFPGILSFHLACCAEVGELTELNRKYARHSIDVHSLCTLHSLSQTSLWFNMENLFITSCIFRIPSRHILFQRIFINWNWMFVSGLFSFGSHHKTLLPQLLDQQTEDDISPVSLGCLAGGVDVGSLLVRVGKWM